jgi:hypothetical protein
MRAGELGATVALLLSCSAAFALDPIEVQVDSHRCNSQASVTAWTGYALGRQKFRKDHHLPTPSSGYINPTFEEEVAGRTKGIGIYQEFHATDKASADPYWEQLCSVQAHHFVDAYVWTFHHQSSWPATARPRNISHFQAWSRANLRDHIPHTNAALAVGTSKR